MYKSANKNLITALDIGSHKIAAGFLDIKDSENVELIAFVKKQSHGFHGGMFTNIKEFEYSLLTTINQLEEKINDKITEVIVTISDNNSITQYISEEFQLNGQIINSELLNDILFSILSKYNNQHYKIIHHFINNYTIDDMHLTENPIGLVANKIKVDISIILMSKNFINNLENCLSTCKVELADLMISSYASGLGSVSKLESENGVTIIDFGYSSTNLIFLLKEKIIYIAKLPIGTMHISSDIAYILSINHSLAEKLKNLYGGTISSIQDNYEMIKIGENKVSKATLIEIITTRLEEILELLKAKIIEDKMQHILNYKIIVTGGGAEIFGITELISNFFKTNVKIAKIHKSYINENITKNNFYDPSFIHLFGIAKYVIMNKENYTNIISNQNNRFSNILSKIRKLLHI